MFDSSTGMIQGEKEHFIKTSKRWWFCNCFGLLFLLLKEQCCVSNGRQNSVDDCTTLPNSLLEFSALNHGVDWRFQNNNASINVSRVMKTRFDKNIIDLIDWPAKSLV